MLGLSVLIILVGAFGALGGFELFPQPVLRDCVNLGHVEYTDYLTWHHSFGTASRDIINDFQLDDGSFYKDIFIQHDENYKITEYLLRNGYADLYACKTTNLFNEEVTAYTIKAVK